MSEITDTENRYARGHRASQGARRVGYLVAIVVHLAILYVAQNALRWNASFITEDWADVVWAIRLSALANVAANVVFLFFDYRPFQGIIQVALNALSLLVMYLMYTVFPFSFDLHVIEVALRVVLILGMFGVVVGTIVELVRAVFGKQG